MDLNELDLISQIAMTNLYTLSKDKKQIILKSFNPKDESHLGLLYVASIGHKIFQFPIYLNMGLIKFLLFKIKYRKIISVKRIAKVEGEYPSCNEFIHHIVDANKSVGAFEMIYNLYFGDKKQND